MKKPRSKKDKLAPKSPPRSPRPLEPKDLERVTGGEQFVINEYDA